jgi:hypothetical protein
MGPTVWALQNLDRILAAVAVVISCVAMYDVRHLFRELKRRDEATEERVRRTILQEMQNHTSSIAAFFRACQYIDFNPLEMNRESAFLLLMTFRVQQLLSPTAPKASLAQLRAETRKQIEVTAQEYATLIINSGIGRMKEGYSLGNMPS